MIGEQAPLGRENQENKQNEFQAGKSAFSGGTLVLRSGSRGWWRLVLERSMEEPWGEPCTVDYIYGKFGHLLLSLHLCVMESLSFRQQDQSEYQWLCYIESMKMQILGRREMARNVLHSLL